MYPQNFYDVTSSLLLTQPEPQYLYADFWLGSMSLSLSLPGEMGLPGRSISGVGASYSSAERDRLMLEGSSLSRELVATKFDFNGMPGNNVRINRPVFTNSTYTEASRRIAS